MTVYLVPIILVGSSIVPLFSSFKGLLYNIMSPCGTCAKAQEQPLLAVALGVPPLQPLAQERLAPRPSLLEEGRGQGNGDAVTGGALSKTATSGWLKQ